MYDDLLKSRNVNIVEGLPLSLCDNSLLSVNKNNLLIIDDLMNDAINNVEVQNVFTKYVHHGNLSCLYLVQNLFFQGRVSRTIHLNTNYLVYFGLNGVNGVSNGLNGVNGVRNGLNGVNGEFT